MHLVTVTCVLCACSVIGYALIHSELCVCVCVCVLLYAVPSVPVSHVWCSVFGCVSVCWYRLCIHSQSSVHVCVCAGTDCALSHSEPGVCVCVCVFWY